MAEQNLNSEELEAGAAAPDGISQLAALAAELDEARGQLAASRTDYAATVAVLRDTMRTANPRVPPELIDGGSPAELTAALDRGRQLAAQAVELARTGPSPNGPVPKVPSGAGGSTSDTAGLSGFEKLVAGLAARRA